MGAQAPPQAGVQLPGSVDGPLGAQEWGWGGDDIFIDSA